MKLVVVTGGTKGLGIEISRKLLAAGYRVVAIGRTKTMDMEVLLESYGGRFALEIFDLSEINKIKSLALDIVAKYGRPWGLVNNAAIGKDGVLATQHESEISMLLRVNVESPIVLTKHLLRPMLISRGGRIINISSIIANTGFNGLSVYAATKAALLGFTRSLAREVGKADISVNAILPGYMETEMTAGIDEAKLATIKRRSPFGRLARTADVAAMVEHLLDENITSISGTCITIDAGSTS